MLADTSVFFDASLGDALRDYTYPRVILTYGLNPLNAFPPPPKAQAVLLYMHVRRRITMG